MDSIPRKTVLKLGNRSRILRLHLPGNRQDTPVCYVHTKGTNGSCINGQTGTIRLIPAGVPLPSKYDSSGLIIVLGGTGISITGDSFLSFGEGEAILKTKSPDKNGAIEAQVLVPGFLTVSQSFEFWKPIRVGILTVSDKGSRGEREDTAGPALAESISRIGGEAIFRNMVPDEIPSIQKTLREWSDENCHLILITGGTGLSARDVTPESLLAICDRQVPGLGEYIRMKTAENTPRAILSRGLAVTLGKTLILSFPGSERGARECFDVVAPVLRHAIEILRGWGGECGGHHHH